MGVAYYLETEGELTSFDVEKHIDGKFLVMVDEYFQDGIYEELAITPLNEFLGGDASENIDEEDITESAQEAWFDASNGLITIVSIIEYLESDLSTMFDFDSDGVIDELRLVEEVLISCERVGMRWHFVMDI